MRLTVRAGAVGAAVFALLTVASSVWPDATADKAHPVVTGCAIRFDGPIPRIHQNSTHLCTGAHDVSVTPAGDLVVHSSTAGPVISVIAEEDETLTELGIQAGASGGTGIDDGTPVRPVRLSRACRLAVSADQLRESLAALGARMTRLLVGLLSLATLIFLVVLFGQGPMELSLSR